MVQICVSFNHFLVSSLLNLVIILASYSYCMYHLILFNSLRIMMTNLHANMQKCMYNLVIFIYADEKCLVTLGLWLLWWVPEEVWECQCMALLHWCFRLPYPLSNYRWNCKLIYLGTNAYMHVSFVLFFLTPFLDSMLLDNCRFFVFMVVFHRMYEQLIRCAISSL